MSLVVTLGSLRFPLTPEKINVAQGTVVQTIAILDLGSVSFPRGFHPTEVSFEGVFVGEDRQSLSVVSGWVDPNALVSQIDQMRRTGARVTFIIPGTPLNLTVFVKSFDWHIEGAFGDIPFSLALTEARDIIVMTQGQEATSTSSRPAVPTLPPTYIVRSGDSLQSIAKLLYGDSSLWATLYNANKETIDALDPTTHSILYAGTILVVPGGGGS